MVGEVVGAVIQDAVEAEPPHYDVLFGLGASQPEDFRTADLGDLPGYRTDAASRAGNKDCLPRLHVADFGNSEIVLDMLRSGDSY